MTYALETVIGLAVLVALGIAIVFAARRGGIGRRTGQLALVGRLSLDARRAVYLVRVGKSVYVIGASEGGLTKLGELDAASLPEASSMAESTAMWPVLERALKNVAKRKVAP
jgi:flagellar biogenesis protein FliO